jgi:hypothetical protein
MSPVLHYNGNLQHRFCQEFALPKFILNLNMIEGGGVVVKATSLKVAGSRSDEVNEFFQFTKSFQPH